MIPVVPRMVANRVTFEAVDIVQRCSDPWGKDEARVRWFKLLVEKSGSSMLH